MNALRDDPLDQVTIVTVTYHSARLVEALADTLAPFPHVCVVDNASTDDTVSALSARLPGARCLVNPTNVGFGAANNRALATVTTPYALLLNPDCTISPDSLRLLLATMTRYPAAGIASPQPLRPDGTPEAVYRLAFYKPVQPRPYRIPDAVCSTEWLAGCCLLVRTDAFRQIGGFDEGFFLFYEDDDLCLRLRQAGFDCLVEPAAQVTHIGGGASAPSWRTRLLKHYHYARSRRRIIGKYLGRPAEWAYRGKLVLAAPLAVLLYALTFQRRHVLKWLAWGWSAVRP